MDLRERPRGDFVRHPWEVARAEFFAGVVAESAALCGGARILDVGAGDGWLAHRVAARCPEATLVCWDEGYARGGSAGLAPAACSRVSFQAGPPQGRFDLLLVLDVLEHVEHERGWLEALVHDRLQPGGQVLVSVPAWPSLLGAHDRRLGHRRRYTRRSARALLRCAGLQPLRSGGLFHSLLPLRWLAKRFDAPPADEAANAPQSLQWRYGSRTARWAARVLALDAALGAAAGRLRLDLPGLSWWALCARSR